MTFRLSGRIKELPWMEMVSVDLLPPGLNENTADWNLIEKHPWSTLSREK